MSLTGGKRKVNKSLKAWVAFVKKVQKEEKLSYKDAIHRAKQRKDKGEKWMSGGASMEQEKTPVVMEETVVEETTPMTESPVQEVMEETVVEENPSTMMGGKKRRRTMRRARGKARARTARRGRARSSRRN